MKHATRARETRQTKRQIATASRAEAIRRAAGQVFAARGVDRARMADVAAAAGVAKGTVYLYYRSKDDVYRAVLRHGLAGWLDRIGGEADVDRPADARLRAFMTGTLQYLDERQDFLRLYHAETWRAASAPRSEARRVEAARQALVGVLDEILQAGVRQHAIRPIPDARTAATLLDLLQGIAIGRLQRRRLGPLAADAAFIFSLVWQGLGAHPASASP